MQRTQKQISSMADKDVWSMGKKISNNAGCRLDRFADNPLLFPVFAEFGRKMYTDYEIVCRVSSSHSILS